MKNLVAYATIVMGTVMFTFGPAHAFINDGDLMQDARNSGNGQVNGNAEGRGVATFSMNFSASANTKGNFDADGMTQNMFDTNTRSQRPYYYLND